MFGANFAIVLVAVTIFDHGRAALRTRRLRSLPPWHAPCGESYKVSETPVELRPDDITKSIQAVVLQHKMTLDNYLRSDYEFVYSEVRLGVNDRQYVPNWLPGSKTNAAVERLTKADHQTIADNLPKFHTDLQKFAVAFEELVKDETDEKTRDRLTATKHHLMTMLCEVHMSVDELRPAKIPKRIHRSIMSAIERNPVDDTRRHVRDWGVLLKYKDYLHAWRRVFDY